MFIWLCFLSFYISCFNVTTLKSKALRCGVTTSNIATEGSIFYLERNWMRFLLIGFQVTLPWTLCEMWCACWLPRAFGWERTVQLRHLVLCSSGVTAWMWEGVLLLISNQLLVAATYLPVYPHLWNKVVHIFCIKWKLGLFKLFCRMTAAYGNVLYCSLHSKMLVPNGDSNLLRRQALNAYLLWNWPLISTSTIWIPLLKLFNYLWRVNGWNRHIFTWLFKEE